MSKMKKQLIPIFVLSIISIIFSVVSLGMGIWSMSAADSLAEATEDTSDGILALFAVFGSVILILAIVILIIAFAVTALLGAFGLVCALKNGRFSLVCLILGSIGTVLSLSGIPALLESITNNFEPIYLVPFIYFGGYTACAVVAFLHRKKVVQNEKTSITSEDK